MTSDARPGLKSRVSNLGELPVAVDRHSTPVLEFVLSAVSVAKRLRRQVVALEIEGSNPFAHPT